MTNETTVYGGTAVATLPAPAAAIKRSCLRSAAKAKANEEAAAAIASSNNNKEMEEEGLAVGTTVLPEHDEEITSEEDEEGDNDHDGPDDEKTERTMLNVALMKSVVETTTSKPAEPESGASSSSPTKPCSPRSPPTSAKPTFSPRTSPRSASRIKDSNNNPQQEKPHSYGLRKRRRPSRQDLERLEHFQSTKEGGLARALSSSGTTINTAVALAAESTTTAEPINTVKRKQQQQQTQKDFDKDSIPATTAINKQRRLNPPVSTTTSTVPNPLLAAVMEEPLTITTNQQLAQPDGNTSGVLAAPLLSGQVPCPLSSSAQQEQTGETTTMTTESNVTKQLPRGTKMVTIQEEPRTSIPTTTIYSHHHQGHLDDDGDAVRKTRGFSIDLDLNLDEFPDDGSTGAQDNDHDGAGQTTTTSDLAVSMADRATSIAAVATSGGGRDRAFSFECFAFGINADEPLPPLESSGVATSHLPPNLAPSTDFADALHHSLRRPRADSVLSLGLSSLQQRPRGDSIIFDPVSFQDGGIHEQSALVVSTAPETNIPTDDSAATLPSSTISSTNNIHASMPAPANVPPARTAAGSSSSTTRTASSPRASTGGTKTTTTATTDSNSTKNTTTHTTTVTSSASASISLELVNKDGRIGIYLPEARRARIARFHAKRSRRIWRKRIKYDCRKKLADSRPRIKGRFVKRSDLED